MTSEKDTQDAQLDVLMDNEEVAISSMEDGSWLVGFRMKFWLLWPERGRWVEVDGQGRSISDVQYGTVDEFERRNIWHAKDSVSLPSIE